MTSYTLPDGTTVSDTMAFTCNGVQYPENWLRFSTPEDRQVLGLVELPQAAWYDQRFYLAPNQPKELSLLVAEHEAHVRANANAVLQSTDWMVLRQADNGTPIPAAVKAWRDDVRKTASLKVLALQTAASLDELIAVVDAPGWEQWPAQPA